MNNTVRLAIICLGIYVALEVFTEGLDGAFGGALGFLASSDAALSQTHEAGSRPGDVVERTHFYDDSAPDANGATRRVPITDSVRERVKAHNETAARRQDSASGRSGL